MSWNPYSGRNRHHPYAGSFPNVYAQNRPAGGSSPAPVAPPDLVNLLHWFDLTDASTVFSDALGTIPAVNGGVVRNITNKGTNGTDMDTVANPGEEPIYRVGLGLNGLNYLDCGGFDYNIFGVSAAGHALIANGATMGAVVRRSGSTTINQTPFHWHIRSNISIGNNSQGPFEGRIQLGDAGLIEPIVSPTMALNDWYLMYATANPSGVDFKYGSPGPETTYTNIPDTDIPVSQEVRFGTQILTQEFHMFEQWFWGGPLDTADRASLRAYVTGKYGALPNA